MTNPRQSSPVATVEQCEAERLALQLIEEPAVRAARESARAGLLADPVARSTDGYLGLDRALDQWVLALVMRVVNADAARPRVIWNVYNPPRAWFGHTYPGAAVAIDNPDNFNREISTDGEAAYIVRGLFAKNPAQFTIEIVADFAGYAGLGRTLAALTSQQITPDENGTFSITVDSAPTGTRAHHLQSEPGKLWIFVRDSMSDWQQSPAALTVERISGPPIPPPRSNTDIINDIVANMDGWVAFWRSFKDGFVGYPDSNRLVGPNGRPGGWGFLAGGRFRLAGGEALVITTAETGAAYTGFQIADPWTISPDPATRLVSLNKAQVSANPDGSITYVLCASDPGVHNWIDTAGLTEGWMMMRWQGVPPTSDPALFIRSVDVVPLSNLSSFLPGGTPRIEFLRDRAAQIARRIEEHARRFAYR
jgi:hypothetical protein